MNFPSFSELKRKTLGAASKLTSKPTSSEVVGFANQAMQAIRVDLLKDLKSFEAEHVIGALTQSPAPMSFSFKTIVMRVDDQEVDALSEVQQAELVSEVSQRLTARGYTPQVEIDYTSGLNHSAYLDIKFDVPA